MQRPQPFQKQKPQLASKQVPEKVIPDSKPRLGFLGGLIKKEEVNKLLESKGLNHLGCFVFAGRSNVGKSSLLNALTYTKLARVSSVPGKTREMNLYHWKMVTSQRITDTTDSILMDLPGYGFAKVSGSLKMQWGKEISDWLISAGTQVKAVLVLIDSRHGFMPRDQELVDFLQVEQIPFVVAFTKFDKWKSRNQQNNAAKQLLSFSTKLGIAKSFFVSIEEVKGLKELEKYLLDCLKNSDSQ